jgi:hypothetical protein
MDISTHVLTPVEIEADHEATVHLSRLHCGEPDIAWLTEQGFTPEQILDPDYTGTWYAKI